MGRKRNAKRRNWPDNLYENSVGYFFYRNPHSKETKGLGRDKATAFTEARAANAVLATMSKSDLASWVVGTTIPTLAAWVPTYKDLWIERTAPAASTISAHSRYLKRIAESDMGWRLLPDITTAHASTFLDEVEKTSGPGAATNVRSKLSDVFRLAETKGYIKQGANPVAATYAADSEVKRERLSLEQFLAIRAKASPILVNAMNLALVTAQRREDIVHMSFSDMKDGGLYVAQGKGQGRVRLKLDVKIRLAAADMSIEQAVKQCRDNVVSSFMVHHAVSHARAKAGGMASVNYISSEFTTARKAAGIEASEGRTPPSFHEIRSLAERLYRAEFGAEFAQAMLGHKNAKMTNEYDDLRGSGWQIVTAKF